MNKEITKELLEELYIKKKIEKDIICKQLNISKRHFTRLCKRFNIVQSPKNIQEKKKRNFLKRYGVNNPNKLEKVREKFKQTCLERYGVDNPAKSEKLQNRYRQTCLEKYGVDCFLSSKEVRARIQQTNLQQYGSKVPSENPQIAAKIRATYATGIPQKKISKAVLERFATGIPQKKAYETMKKNGTLIKNSSKEEEQAYQLLLTKFKEEDIIRQYKSELYPFKCDFYIKSLDLYIEYNGGQYHGKHPFNENSEEDKQRLVKLKYKYFANPESTYKAMIKVWTKLDPLKREIAKKNNLNYKEFFSLKEFEGWLNI